MNSIYRKRSQSSLARKKSSPKKASLDSHSQHSQFLEIIQLYTVLLQSKKKKSVFFSFRKLSRAESSVSKHSKASERTKSKSARFAIRNIKSRRRTIVSYHNVISLWPANILDRFQSCRWSVVKRNILKLIKKLKEFFKPKNGLVEV